MASLSGEAEAATLVDRQQPIGVRVADLAGVPHAITTGAVRQAARIFQKIGVTIVWDEALDPPPKFATRPFIVQINLTPDEAGTGRDWV